MLLAGSAFFTASLLVQPAAGATTSAAASWVAATLDKLPATAGLQQLPQQELMWLALSAGFVTALASSACHNSLFTPCKQMVYKIMPAHEIKEAKAVVDLVGGQVGRQHIACKGTACLSSEWMPVMSALSIMSGTNVGTSSG